MTNKMIDADAVNDLLAYVSQEQRKYCGEGTYNEDIDDIFISFRKKINELATPAPVYDEKNIYAILDVLSKRLKDEKKDADFLSNKVNTFINGYNRAILIAISTITNLIDKATPAPEPQESIFDENGWCWDMSAVPIDENILLLCESCLILEAVIARKPFKDAELQYSTENFCGCCTITETAWRPLPPLPTPTK